MSKRQFHYCAMAQTGPGATQYSHGIWAIDTTDPEAWYLQFCDRLADFMGVERDDLVVMSLAPLSMDSK